MEKLGKLTFRKLEETDLDALQQFCNTCSDLKYYNNSSFNSLKLDQMKMPYGQYFIGYDEDKNIIFNICGVHQMFEINDHAYRVFFRGASLPGYTTGKLGIKSSFQLVEILNMQIDFILKHEPNAEFYFTTNLKRSETNGKSQRMDELMTPRVARTGIFNIISEDFEYMYTRQRLWRVNIPAYKKWRLC